MTTMIIIGIMIALSIGVAGVLVTRKAVEIAYGTDSESRLLSADRSLITSAEQNVEQTQAMLDAQVQDASDSGLTDEQEPIVDLGTISTNFEESFEEVIRETTAKVAESTVKSPGERRPTTAELTETTKKAFDRLENYYGPVMSLKFKAKKDAFQIDQEILENLENILIADFKQGILPISVFPQTKRKSFLKIWRSIPFYKSKLSSSYVGAVPGTLFEQYYKMVLELELARQVVKSSRVHASKLLESVKESGTDEQVKSVIQLLEAMKRTAAETK